ncbi:uncharacterized protein ACJ7VT_002401 isoform 1-T1 [Polymixia lowei]
MPLLGSDMCVPALLGMEYPDPMGSGLSVPVLGSQTDLVSGIPIPLAGTMEDPEGKGLVAIRCGSQTVDPVTGVLAPVVGARLDVSRKTVVPVTASYWLTVTDHTDSIQVEALQREVYLLNNYWQQQRQKEEKILSDLDSALLPYLSTVTQANSDQVQWSEPERQLREAVVELQDSAQREAQRRAAQCSHLALLLPPHILHILTQGEEEWEQQCVWQSELVSGVDKIDVCIERLQQEQEQWTSQEGERALTLHAMDRELRQRELWEQVCSRQADLDVVLTALQSVRHLSQLCADTAQAVLSGNFWYKDYGLSQCSGTRPCVKVLGLVQQKALPLLEKLSQLLEDKQPASLSPSTCPQHISGLSTKQTYGLEMCSRVWTASVPVVKGVSTQSLREPVKIQSQDTAAALHASSSPTHNSQRHTTSSGIHRQESQPVKERVEPTHICVPTMSEEEWDKLLELSPLFQLLKRVELQLKGRALESGLLRRELSDKGNSFVDVLDAQWECEGELIPLDPAVLNPREFLVYQHGLFLINTLHNLKLTPAVSLKMAGSLPNNNYFNNAFRNSFFYQEAEETLFVRRQRLQSVGGFSLLLLHCLAHLTIGDMSSDSSPAFQRLFFKTLQGCLGELFQARLGVLSSGQEVTLGACFPGQGDPPWDVHGTLADWHATSLLDRLQTPSRVISQDEVGVLQKKHSDTSLFSRVEGLLRDRSCSGVTDTDLMGSKSESKSS